MAIIVKGNRVAFQMKDAALTAPPRGIHAHIDPKSGALIYKLPPGYGILHDPDGTERNRCEVFFGKVAKTQRPPSVKSNKATRYFGTKYTQHEGRVDVPTGPWKSIGEVVQIFYARTQGSQYEGRYFHVFKRRSPMLSKCKNVYRLALQDGCIIDDRGFVFP